MHDDQLTDSAAVVVEADAPLLLVDFRLLMLRDAGTWRFRFRLVIILSWIITMSRRYYGLGVSSISTAWGPTELLANERSIFVD